MYDPLRAKAKVAFFSVAAFLTGLVAAANLGWTSTSDAMPVVEESPQVARESVQPALDLSEAFINVSDAVTPAVVRIEAVRRPEAGQQQVPEQFRRFFGDPDGTIPQVAGGSGFIVSTDGYILTNDHVVSGAEQLTVFFPDRRYFEARLIGTDPFTDVAVIKIDVDEDLPTLSLGNSDEVRVGEWVLAIGNPGFGAGNQLDYTVTAGIVSARGRGLGLINRGLRREGVDNSIAGFAIEDYIQTDAVINPGNSGGPMVDIRGRVLGINSAIASDTGFFQGYGFAIPINLARRIMEDLVEYGQVRRAQLGVQIDEVDLDDAEAYGLPSVQGVLIQAITAGGPAESADLQQGDVIVAIDGDPVAYVGQLQGMVTMRRPGDRVTVTVYRDRSPRDVSLRLGEATLTEEVIASRPVEGPPAEARLGIVVEDMTADLARDFGYDEVEGVVITRVQIASPANRRGLGPSQRILEINGRQTESREDVAEILDSAEAGSVVQFVIELPDGSSRVVNVRVPQN